jgi:glycosyltransferase involved in cell wall biosynthesis
VLDSQPHNDLVLFFTQGMSLIEWDRVGMFDREVALYRGLQERGVQVSFVTYGDASELAYVDRIPGIRILCNRWNLSMKRYENWLHLLHGRWLRKSDVIKTNQTIGAHLALRAARFWKKPLVARCGYMWSEFVQRDHGESSQPAQLASETEQNVFSAAQRVVVTTKEMEQSVIERVPAASVTIIPNYVDTKLFRPTEISHEPTPLIYVGRLAPQKNVSSLLQAVRNLNTELLVIGDGRLGPEFVDRYSLGDGHIKWIKSVPNAELPLYFNNASIFVLPSFYEGHPKTLIEAMSCGLPVIGANSPGISDLITHGENGYLCGTTPEGIQKAIQDLIENPDLCKRLGQNARSYAVENFSLEKTLEMELTLLREVAGK